MYKYTLTLHHLWATDFPNIGRFKVSEQELKSIRSIIMGSSEPNVWVLFDPGDYFDEVSRIKKERALRRISKKLDEAF